MVQRSTAAIVLAGIGLSTPHAVAQSIELAGQDHSGYLSMSCLKNWGSAAFALQGLPDYPYFFKPDAFDGQGVWTSLVAEPLSPDARYPEARGADVLNRVVLDPDYATRSSGRILFDESQLDGVGFERLGPEFITIEVDGEAFSPLNSVHNAGSGVGNAGWDYVVAVSNVSGEGIRFREGEPVSVCLRADVAVTVRFLGIDAGAFPNTYDGVVTFSGDAFAFDIDVTQDNDTLLGMVTDTRLVFNRSGTIAAIATWRRCPADVAPPAGIVDARDLTLFAQGVVRGDPIADVNLDGRTDYFDVTDFFRSYTIGCPAIRCP